MFSKILKCIKGGICQKWITRALSECVVGDPCLEFKRIKLDPQCKVAIVTGGATGIGYAAATELLCNGARSVIVAQKDEKRGLEAAEMLCNNFGMEKGIYMPCDVNCPKQFEDVFRNTITQFRKVDIFFNNAGIIDDKDWDLSIHTNVIGTIRGNLLAQKYMGGKGGVVINTCAIAGLSPWPNCPIFSASKHAVVTASRCFGDSFHYNTTNIRVIGLCPGFTKTQAWDRGLKRHLFDDWGAETTKCLKKMRMQSPAMVGKALVHVVKFAESGSIWVCDQGYLYQVESPTQNEYLRAEPVS